MHRAEMNLQRFLGHNMLLAFVTLEGPIGRGFGKLDPRRREIRCRFSAYENNVFSREGTNA